MISTRTGLYGVVGHPVGHSRSPAMQNAALASLAVDALYVALPVAPERLGEALRGAHALGFRGLNVTVPHKQAAAALCLRLEESAAACGAVNTLIRAPGGEPGWVGHNTDAPAGPLPAHRGRDGHGCAGPPPRGGGRGAGGGLGAPRSRRRGDRGGQASPGGGGALHGCAPGLARGPVRSRRMG